MSMNWLIDLYKLTYVLRLKFWTYELCWTAVVFNSSNPTRMNNAMFRDAILTPSLSSVQSKRIVGESVMETNTDVINIT